MLTFGVTILPDPPYTRLIELMTLAEQQGFDYGWTYDSHVLWQESTPVLALLAQATTRMKLGQMVANPATRDPTLLASTYATLHDISDGRMVMGVGRGDSAVRYIGRQPMPVGLTEHVKRCTDAGAGEIMIQSIDRDGTMSGYDIRLIELTMAATGVPVIGAGGSGNYEHLKDAFLSTGVAALACGSLFNFSDSNPIRAKAFLSNYGLPFKVV